MNLQESDIYLLTYLTLAPASP